MHDGLNSLLLFAEALQILMSVFGLPFESLASSSSPSSAWRSKCQLNSSKFLINASHGFFFGSLKVTSKSLLIDVRLVDDGLSSGSVAILNFGICILIM